ncbi:MAG: transcription antitermination factor NusB [Deltaproteobacteria bacterium]|nr:transcription antitermination factor NusB [Deltaproteobacteria bacterium]
MKLRRHAREFALQILYQIEVQNLDLKEGLNRFWENFNYIDSAKDFSTKLVKGVIENKKFIDTLIEKFSEHWRLDRINWVERNILRIAIFELLFMDDIPPKVSINEAIDIGKRYGTSDSGAFINGILDQILTAIEKGKISLNS